MFCATAANASCAFAGKQATQPEPQWQSGHVQTEYIRTGYVRVFDRSTEESPIVGLWKFAFVAKGNNPPGPPDDVVVDAGYVTWHSDGTELMNSGRAPTTGDFCMGIWKPVGPSTVKLNHFALAFEYNPNTLNQGPGTGGADFTGPAQIRETVTVDSSGNRYAGDFVLTQYAADGKTVIARVKGKVAAKRITLESSAAD
jgi:hypothetical protein